MALDDIDVSVLVSYTGGWLELEDVDSGYELHADSFNQAVATHRNGDLQNRWVEGTWAAWTVRDNVTESLVFWVRGSTQGEYRARMELAKACFDQAVFTVVKTLGNSIEQWDCKVSDYTEESQQEYIHRTMGLLRVQLQRRPRALLSTLNPAILPTQWWTTLVIANTTGELPVGSPAVGTPARPFYLEDVDT